MNIVDNFVMELERKEADEDMHFSVFYIPECYNDTEEINYIFNNKE